MNLKKILKELHLKKKINRVIRLLFSDRFQTETESEQDMFVKELCDTMDKRKLLFTYFCIQFVTTDISYSKFYPPITKKEIKDLSNELDRIDKYFYDEEFAKLTLKLHKLKAYRNLRLTSYYFNSGRRAFLTNNFSFEGLRYTKEKYLNRPLTIAEYNKTKESVKNISKLNADIDELENKYESHLTSLRVQEVIDNIRIELNQIVNPGN
jgi:hypothetical protein